MKTDGGWVNITECARLYGKDRKWVYDQIKRYQIETRKENNRKILRLVDLIQHRGEPPNGAPTHTETHTEDSQKITPALTPTADKPTGETELLKQENQFLKEKIGELEADRSERQAREVRWEDERARRGKVLRTVEEYDPATNRWKFRAACESGGAISPIS